LTSGLPIERLRAACVRHDNCREDGVPKPLLLLAEPDQSLRELMWRTLAGIGFDVLESSSFAHLEVYLRLDSVLRAERVLLVLGVRMAQGSSASIRALARERARQLLPPVHVVLTYEFGTLTSVAAPDLSPCHLEATLEKPFDLQVLQGVATTFLRESEAGPHIPPDQARGAGP
jgi:hypothetical protein